MWFQNQIKALIRLLSSSQPQVLFNSLFNLDCKTWKQLYTPELCHHRHIQMDQHQHRLLSHRNPQEEGYCNSTGT